jgi:hypothetical protein
MTPICAPVEHIPGVLHRIDAAQPHRLFDLPEAEIGDADVACFALPHDVVERCQRLGERR